MAGTLPPFFPINDDTHSGYVAVAVYTMLALMAATVATRLFTRWYIARVVHTDDILLGGGTVSVDGHSLAGFNHPGVGNCTEYPGAKGNEQWIGKQTGNCP